MDELTAAFDGYQALRGFSEATRDRRRWTLTAFERETAGLRHATLLDVETFVGRRRKPATRRAILGDLRAFYRWALDREIVTADPSAKLEMPKVPKGRPTPLTSDDLGRVLAASIGRTQTMVMLCALAGLRVSEVAALHADDVWVPHHLTVRNGKGGKDRTIPLHPLLARELAGRRGTIIGTSGENVSKCIRHLFDTLDIDARPHDLRHSFGTEAARVAKGDLVLVAGLMGHESIATTLGYVGYRPDSAAVVAAMFAA